MSGRARSGPPDICCSPSATKHQRLSQQTNPCGGPAISDRPATTWAAITEHRQMQRAARGGLCGLGRRRPGKRPCPSDPAPGDPRDSQTRHPTEASRPGVHHSRMRGKKDGRPRTHRGVDEMGHVCVIAFGLAMKGAWFRHTPRHRNLGDEARHTGHTVCDFSRNCFWE